MIEMLRRAGIGSLGIVQRGDDVPGGATVQEKIDRGKHACDVERLVIRRRIGHADAEPARRKPHRQRNCNRIQLGGANSMPDRFPEIVAIAIRYREPVIKERQMELSPLQGPSDVFVIFAREPVRLRRRMAPGGRIIRAILGLQKADQFHLPGHAPLPHPVWRACRARRAAVSGSQYWE